MWWGGRMMRSLKGSWLINLMEGESEEGQREGECIVLRGT